MKRKSKNVYKKFLVLSLIVGVFVFSVKGIDQYFLSDKNENVPLSISFMNEGKDIPVSKSLVLGDEWLIPDDSVAYLSQSALPGTGGNVVMYGHNTRNVLGFLNNVENGDSITLVNQSGKEYEYKVWEKKVVDPDMIEIAQPTEYEMLTVYTCTGWNDSKRLVIRAYPSRVASN